MQPSRRIPASGAFSHLLRSFSKLLPEFRVPANKGRILPGLCPGLYLLRNTSLLEHVAVTAATLPIRVVIKLKVQTPHWSETI